MTAVGLGVLVVGLLGASIVLHRVPRLRAVTGRSGTLPVIVIVPARNEAAVIGGLLADLAAQDTPPARVVVVDDHSTDGTGDVVRRWSAVLPLEVRRCPPTPPGWNPKSWALADALDDTTGSSVTTHFLFLDADVRLSPTALAAIMAAGPTDAGLVSIAPRHEIGRPVEALSAVPNVVAVLGASAGAGRGRAAGAFGPCLRIRRDSYVAAGGHRADGEDLLDDVALAARVRATGAPVHLLRGGVLVRYRMYPHGTRTIIDGWVKNIAAGARRTPPGRALLVALWITALLLPAWWMVGGVSTALSGGSWRGGLFAGVAWLVVGVHSALTMRAVGRFGLMAPLLAPLLALVFVSIVARSAFLLVTRRPVRWKDRLLSAQGRP